VDGGLFERWTSRKFDAEAQPVQCGDAGENGISTQAMGCPEKKAAA